MSEDACLLAKCVPAVHVHIYECVMNVFIPYV